MKNSPTLLMLTERFAPDLGGVARSAFRTANALSRLGVDVHVLAWTRTLQPGELSSSTEASHSVGGITVHRLGLFSNWDFSMQHTSNVLEWLHEQHDFDGVWGHYVYPAGFMAVLFAETAGLPSTVSARGNDIDRLVFPPGDFARLTWTLDRATVVSSVSKDLASKINILLGRDASCCVLANVVDSDIFHSQTPQTELDKLRKQFGISSHEAVLGFSGELRYKKGLPFLLQALAETNATRPTRLLVIGDVRPREQSTISSFLLDHPELSDQLTVTGHLDQPADVAMCLQICDVVLQPSVWDGLPNSILEGMACGRIVIASDAGGIPEAIKHGETGFLIAKSQLHRLGEGIGEVLDLPTAEQERIGQNARQSVLDHFNADIEARRLSHLLRNLWPEWRTTLNEPDT